MTNYVIRSDLTGWRTRVMNGKCHSCSKPINTKEGYFKLVIDKEHSYYPEINLSFCSKCLENIKVMLNQKRPDLQEEYETKYKLAMIKGIERGNGKS